MVHEEENAARILCGKNEILEGVMTINSTGQPKEI
jgi:hypothetical protein